MSEAAHWSHTSKASSAAASAVTSPQTPPRCCPYRNMAVLSPQLQLQLPRDHPTSMSPSAQHPLPVTHPSITSFLTLGRRKESRLNQVEAYFCLCFQQPCHNPKKKKKKPMNEEEKTILPQKVAEGFWYES